MFTISISGLQEECTFLDHLPTIGAGSAAMFITNRRMLSGLQSKLHQKYMWLDLGSTLFLFRGKLRLEKYLFMRLEQNQAIIWNILSSIILELTIMFMDKRGIVFMDSKLLTWTSLILHETKGKLNFSFKKLEKMCQVFLFKMFGVLNLELFAMAAA